MNVNFELLPGAVATSHAASKPAVFQALATCFGDTYGLDPAVVLDGLEERERLGSTGFGHNVAIPHARIDGIECPVAALLKLDASVNFDAADGMPVNLVIGLLSPTNAGVAHLHALAAISRMVRDEEIHASLFRAEDSDALFAALTNITGGNIANDNANGANRERA